jgi:hypothetical protein
VTSFRTVDDWFANPDVARAEIERLLSATGERMARELLDENVLPKCAFRSRENGELDAK